MSEVRKSTDLIEQLDSDLVEAMKARDEVRLQVLRLLKAAMHNYAIEIKGDLSPQQMLQLLQKEAKKRQDSIAQYAAADRQDLVEQEEAELTILKSYLPEQPSDEAIKTAVLEVIAEQNATGTAAMGQVVSAVRERFQGAADGALIAQLTREALTASPSE